ncbi:MAG TPA: homoserine dehydrogenase [Candidatus Scubalenecus merdavium]|uniref:Homoserine dehydrogenase n=1 Tax=Candidatus Scybalenecus merdavium TaxID=2840939 RepID=A0A9D1SNK1_9FIRM|nr:homoserine dehydrogenase [Candidatus Scubalenecus merdavium]
MKIAIMGYGTVGSGVAEVLDKNADIICKRLGGEPLEIKRILDLRDFPGDRFERAMTKDFNDILNDPEIAVVAETMGGIHPAFEFTMQLLQAGKSVATSNKELVAQKGLELLEAAEANNANYLFEASVGGGIPVIRPMAQCLAANHIEGVAGILNGTTNFILTKMIEDGMAFADALALAQRKGYAEKDPTADIEGHDACRKVCILASLAFGKHVYPNQVETEGIKNITLEDVAYAASAGGVIKLLGQIRQIDEDRIAAFVSPAIVFNGSQLASVDGVFNAVLIRGDMVGDVCFYGRGAGKLPTASAVAADMMDCAKHVHRKKIFGWGPGNEDYVIDYKATLKMSFYVRAKAAQTQIQSVFDEVKFLTRTGQPSDETAFITDEMTQNELDEKLKAAGIDVLSKIKIANY